MYVCMYVCICVYRERNVRSRVGILCGDCDGDGNRSAVKPRNERERETVVVSVCDRRHQRQPTGKGKVGLGK